LSNRVLIIRPTRALGGSFGEIWDYRELLLFLVWRDLKVRYRQTVLGAAWAILQPAGSAVIFTLLLGRLAKLPSDGVAYPLFAFAGLSVWTYFSSAVSTAANSLVGNASVISKVYFPRVLLPLAAVVVAVVDLVLSLVALVALLAWYRHGVGIEVVAAPAFVLLGAICALALGLWLATLNVRYRDVRYVLPFVTQIWLFATPVVYTLSVLPEPWRRLAWLNPVTAVVVGFRWAVLGTTAPTWWGVAVGAGIALVLLAGGGLYFASAERRFADVV
jgi:lipopolysaccharide transport system permease protein